MADKKISQLPIGSLDGNTIFPIVTSGITSQTTFGDIQDAIGGGESLWSAGTGSNSIIQNNSNSYAIGDNSLVGGQGNSAYTQNSVVFGTNSFVSGATEMANVLVGFTVFSATTTIIQPNVPGYDSSPVGAFVFDGDVSDLWQHYLWDNDNILYLSGGTEPILTLDTGNSWDAFYDSGTDKTYVVFEEITATTYTTVYGSGLYETLMEVTYPSFGFGIEVKTYAKASHAEGYQTKAYGDYSHTEGWGSIASGISSHAEGNYTQANGIYSHAEGNGSKAIGDISHAEGLGSIASGSFSHAEGVYTTASGYHTHAEGTQTIASGASSHAEGTQTKSYGIDSHAQGRFTIASGSASHAGGNLSQANGEFSFVHGENSQANGNYSIVLGREITGATADTTYVDNLNIKTLPIFADNTAATSGGLEVGAVYRTSTGVLMVRF